MKLVRLALVVAVLAAGLGTFTACASRSGGCGGCKGGGGCACAPDRNCCDGCRAGTGCVCNR